MRGAAILVHMANPPAFYGRRIYYSPDGKNLNRVYPGQPDGTVSDRMAHAITREVIDRCTHLADMHCGDGNESLRPYTYWIIGGNAAVDAETRGSSSSPTASTTSWSTATGRAIRPRAGSPPTRPSPAASPRSPPSREASGLTDEPSVAAHDAGARSLLAHLGILDGPSARVTHPVWIDRAEVLRAPVTGVWHPVVEKMQSVSTGRLLGRLTDPFGAVLHEVRAPFAGEVVYVVGTPPVSRRGAALRDRPAR